MRPLSFKRFPFAAAVAVLFLLALSTGADAQAKRRKRPVKSAPPFVVQPQSEPLVISRAEDFPDQNTSVVQPSTDREVVKPIDDPTGKTIEELRTRLDLLESASGKEADQKQKRLLLYLDILTKAEQRSESLRKQVFDMIEKESSVKTRLDSIDLEVRPESIEKNVALAGSLRPEELRESRRRSLSAEKSSLQSLLTEIQRTRAALEQNLQRADSLVERLRSKLDKDINDALADGNDQTSQ